MVCVRPSSEQLVRRPMCSVTMFLAASLGLLVSVCPMLPAPLSQQITIKGKETLNGKYLFIEVMAHSSRSMLLNGRKG